MCSVFCLMAGFCHNNLFANNSRPQLTSSSPRRSCWWSSLSIYCRFPLAALPIIFLNIISCNCVSRHIESWPWPFRVTRCHSVRDHWPLDMPYAISYRSATVAKTLSPIVSEITGTNTCLRTYEQMNQQIWWIKISPGRTNNDRKTGVLHFMLTAQDMFWHLS